MDRDHHRDSRPNAERARDEDRDRSSEPESEFDELQSQTIELDYQELLNDPEYIDFLEAFGELKMPSDGPSEIEDLLEKESNDTQASGEEAAEQHREVIGASAEDDPEASGTEGGRHSADPGHHEGEEAARQFVTQWNAHQLSGPDPDAARTASENPEGDGRRSSTENSAKSQQEADTVEAFIQSVESEEVSDEQRQALRRALDLDTPRHVEVQLNHLKSRFLDLEAYIRTMEDLLDADVDPLADIAELQADLTALRSDLDETIHRIESLESQIQTLEADRSADVERIEDSLDDLQASVQHDVSEIAGELRDVIRWRARLADAAAYDDWDTDHANRRGGHSEDEMERSFEFIDTKSL